MQSDNEVTFSILKNRMLVQDVVGQNDTLSGNSERFKCSTCLNGNRICFCLIPVAELLMKRHSGCSDQELIQVNLSEERLKIIFQFVDKYLERIIPYQPAVKSKGEIIQENGEPLKVQVKNLCKILTFSDFRLAESLIWLIQKPMNLLKR